MRLLDHHQVERAESPSGDRMHSARILREIATLESYEDERSSIILLRKSNMSTAVDNRLRKTVKLFRDSFTPI